jgi:beta-N-acetylhexosaminidase
MIHIVGTLLLVITMAQQYNWAPVQNVVERYRSAGAFTGGILRVSNSSQTIYNLPFGFFSHNDLPFSSPSVTNRTIFDMASVTKVTATLSCIMRLVDLNKVSITDPVSKFIPEYGNNGK